MSQTAQCLRHISHEPGIHSAKWDNDAGYLQIKNNEKKNEKNTTRKDASR